MTLKKMTEGRDPETGRFVSGNNGGPGRQRGSRNKLGEAFVADVYAKWQEHGAQTLERIYVRTRVALFASWRISCPII
jgi:hypothetical protein